MEIRHKDYYITYNWQSATIVCVGALRLPGKEYNPITQLLNQVVDAKPALITLNLEGVEFLNSFGITVFSKFVMNTAKKKTSKLVVKGSKRIAWQRKSLRLFPRLMKGLKLEIV